MARDLSPIGKQSRREGYALAPKAQKVMAKKTGIPGQHADMRVRGGSLYLTQLREKQKASRAEGMTGENLLNYLERRADNVVYRAGFASTRRAARQLVSHGHFTLNGRRIDIPSIRVKPGDVLEVRAKSKKNSYFTNLNDVNSEKTSLSWMKSDIKNMKIEIIGQPKREEAEVGINEQLIVEYYSR